MPNSSSAKNLASPGLRIIRSTSLEGLCSLCADEGKAKETVLGVSLGVMMKLAVSEMVSSRMTSIGVLEFAEVVSIRMLLVRV